MKIIERPEYLEQLVSVIGTQDIKVITGIRRSGKSVLLDSFGKYIERELGDSANIIRVDYNLKDSESLLDHNALYEYVDKRNIGTPHGA